MTSKQAGEYLGVSDSRIRQFIREGRLPKRKFGHGNVVYKSDLDRLARELIADAPKKPGPKPQVMKLRSPKSDGQAQEKGAQDNGSDDLFGRGEGGA